jgi:hypothetical protein
MADYRLHPITWKNVIDYNWLRLQIRLPHVWTGAYSSVKILCVISTPHLKLMTVYDLSLRPYHFKDKHNFLSDPTCNKNDHICIYF